MQEQPKKSPFTSGSDAGATREDIEGLIDALNESAAASQRAAERLGQLTWAIAVLTTILVVLGIVTIID